ncbi:MAG TPA: hypothetical protein VF541_08440 [Longimicrobium sp.]|jgi:hypothetical protein
MLDPIRRLRSALRQGRGKVRHAERPGSPALGALTVAALLAVAAYLLYLLVS